MQAFEYRRNEAVTMYARLSYRLRLLLQVRFDKTDLDLGEAKVVIRKLVVSTRLIERCSILCCGFHSTKLSVVCSILCSEQSRLHRIGAVAQPSAV